MSKHNLAKSDAYALVMVNGNSVTTDVRVEYQEDLDEIVRALEAVLIRARLERSKMERGLSDGRI